MYRQNKAFTLVELIVVIAILAILGTIGFISLQGYQSLARDSQRISDINVIAKALEFNYGIEGRYVSTSSGFTVSYSGSSLWTQGYFTDEVRAEIRNPSNTPVDPLTGNPYIYSLAHTGQEYQLWVALEWGAPLAQNSLMSQTYADFSRAYIKGNYNGAILGKNIWGLLHIFAVPSIIAHSYNDVDIFNIAQNDLFVIDDYAGLPANAVAVPGDETQRTNLWITTPENVLIFAGTPEELSDPANILQIGQSIDSFYSSTPISNRGNIVSFTNLDTAEPSIESEVISRTITNLASLSSIAPYAGTQLTSVIVPNWSSPTCDITQLFQNEINGEILSLATDAINNWNTSNTLFSQKWDATNSISWVKDSNFWAQSLDLSWISVHNSRSTYRRNWTLVTPRHVVFSDHFYPNINNTITFMDSSWLLHTRTIEDLQTSDIYGAWIAQLDSDLPSSISPYRMISYDFFSQVTPNNENFYILGFSNPNSYLDIFEVNDYLVNPILTSHLTESKQFPLFYASNYNLTQEPISNFAGKVYAASSSSPNFILYNWELFLIWSNRSAGDGDSTNWFNASYPSHYSYMIDDLNSKINQMVGDPDLYDIQVFDTLPVCP